MARLWASLGETKRLDKLTLVDGLMLLLQAEKDTRTTNRNARLIKEADFRYGVTLEQLEAGSHRGIDPNMLALLGTGSYLATALGNKACNQGYKVNYFNM